MRVVCQKHNAQQIYQDLFIFFAVRIAVSFNMVAALSHYFCNLNNFIICLLNYLSVLRSRQSAFCYVRPLPKDGNTSRFQIVFIKLEPGNISDKFDCSFF